MANTVFPDLASAGGIVYRNAAGAPLNPPNVQNAYSPAAPFTITPCDAAALPSDCTARIEPRQVNAIVSELLAFAECLNPTGTWDCNSLRNLCAAFSAWMTLNLSTVYVSDTPHPSPIANQTLWWESDTGILWIWYADADSSQWVAISGGDIVVMDGISIVGAGVASDPHKVGLVDCGSW